MFHTKHANALEEILQTVEDEYDQVRNDLFISPSEVVSLFELLNEHK